MWLCESNVREVDLGFAVLVLALEETTGVTLDPEVGSEAVVEVLGGGWAREIGRDLAFALGLDGGVGSSTAMLLSCPPLLRRYRLSLSAWLSRRDLLNSPHQPRSPNQTLPLMICVDASAQNEMLKQKPVIGLGKDWICAPRTIRRCGMAKHENRDVEVGRVSHDNSI
jgi:hypothetical protein